MTFGCSSPTARAHPGWAAGQKKKRRYKHPGVRYDMNFEEKLNQPEQNGFLFGFDILMCLRYPIQQSYNNVCRPNIVAPPIFSTFPSRKWPGNPRLLSSLETDQPALRHPFARKHILLQPHQKTGGWTPWCVGFKRPLLLLVFWCLTFPNSSKQTQFPFLTPWDVLPLPTSVHLASHGGHGLSVPGGLQMAWSLDTRNEHLFWGVSHQRNTLIRWVKMSHSWLPEKDQNGWSYYCCK